MLQARFVIEYSYVHMMSCTKRQAGGRLKKDQLCLLTLLADRLEKVRHCLSILSCIRGWQNKRHRLTERDSRLAHFSERLVIEIPILGYFGVLGFLGYVTTSIAKSDVIFLLSDPDFL